MGLTKVDRPVGSFSEAGAHDGRYEEAEVFVESILANSATMKISYDLVAGGGEYLAD